MRGTLPVALLTIPRGPRPQGSAHTGTRKGKGGELQRAPPAHPAVPCPTSPAHTSLQGGDERAPSAQIPAVPQPWGVRGSWAPAWPPTLVVKFLLLPSRARTHARTHRHCQSNQALEKSSRA